MQTITTENLNFYESEKLDSKIECISGFGIISLDFYNQKVQEIINSERINTITKKIFGIKGDELGKGQIEKHINFESLKIKIKYLEDLNKNEIIDLLDPILENLEEGIEDDENIDIIMNYLTKLYSYKFNNFSFYEKFILEPTNKQNFKFVGKFISNFLMKNKLIIEKNNFILNKLIEKYGIYDLIEEFNLKKEDFDIKFFKDGGLDKVYSLPKNRKYLNYFLPDDLKISDEYNKHFHEDLKYQERFTFNSNHNLLEIGISVLFKGIYENRNLENKNIETLEGQKEFFIWLEKLEKLIEKTPKEVKIRFLKEILIKQYGMAIISNFNEDKNDEKIVEEYYRIILNSKRIKPYEEGYPFYEIDEKLYVYNVSNIIGSLYYKIMNNKINFTNEIKSLDQIIERINRKASLNQLLGKNEQNLYGDYKQFIAQVPVLYHRKKGEGLPNKDISF